MMETSKKLLKSCDIFGQTIQIQYKNKGEYKTLFGGFISLLIVVFVSLLCQRQAKMLFYQEGFQLKIQQKIETNPELAILNKQNFVFGLKIDGQPTTNKKNFFDILVEQKSAARISNSSTPIKNSETLKLVPCSAEYFTNIQGHSLEQEFELLGLQEYFCLPINQSIEISGQYSSQNFSYIKISIAPCTNNCVSEEEINDYLNKNTFFKLTFFQTTYQINPSEQNPLQLFIQNDMYYTFIPNKYYSRSDIFIRSAHLEEDTSIYPFYKNLNKYNIYQVFYEDQRSSQIFTNNANSFGEFYLRKSTHSTSIQKSYMKIDEFFAYVGGLLKLSISIIGLIVINYNRYDLLISLANRLFNFDIPSENRNNYQEINNRILQMIKKIINSHQIGKRKTLFLKSYQQMEEYFQNDIKCNNSINKQQIFRPIKDTSQVQNSKLEKTSIIINEKLDLNLTSQIPEMQSQKTFMNFTICQILNCRSQLSLKIKYLLARLTRRYCFYDNNLDVQMLDTAIRTINKELDAVKMIEKFQQISDLKEIILNQNQILFFNSLPKPFLIPINAKQQQLYFNNKQYNNNKKKQEQKKKKQIKVPRIQS